MQQISMWYTVSRAPISNKDTDLWPPTDLDHFFLWNFPMLFEWWLTCFMCDSTLSLLWSPQVRPHGTIPYCSDLLTDGGCVALLVVGFLLVTPLLVLALAAYCRLARHLQLGLCFIPYSRAVYKNLPATQHRGLGTGCCGGQDGADGSGKGKVWVWGVNEDEVIRKAKCEQDHQRSKEQLLQQNSSLEDKSQCNKYY